MSGLGRATSCTSADLRVALDTNILAYAEGVNGEDRRDAALAVLRGLAADEVLVPAQALGELFVVLTRKARRQAGAARDAVLGWSDGYALVDTTPAVILEAMELVTTHRLGFWDAVMLAAAAQSGCRLLLSEDMQHGFTWRGVTVRNPFPAAA
jgi:predicted nucleic acid-binding protein